VSRNKRREMHAHCRALRSCCVRDLRIIPQKHYCDEIAPNARYCEAFLALPSAWRRMCSSTRVLLVRMT
jgi:hypothetical protein